MKLNFFDTILLFVPATESTIRRWLSEANYEEERFDFSSGDAEYVALIPLRPPIAPYEDEQIMRYLSGKTYDKTCYSYWLFDDLEVNVFKYRQGELVEKYYSKETEILGQLGFIIEEVAVSRILRSLVLVVGEYGVTEIRDELAKASSTLLESVEVLTHSTGVMLRNRRGDTFPLAEILLDAGIEQVYILQLSDQDDLSVSMERADGQYAALTISKGKMIDRQGFSKYAKTTAPDKILADLGVDPAFFKIN